MEKYTSEMIDKLLTDIIACATSATIIAEACDGNLGPNMIQAILKDLRDMRTQALLINSRMKGWDYAAFDEFLMSETRKKYEEHLQEEEKAYQRGERDEGIYRSDEPDHR